jgi:hypothetical protein
VFLLEVVVFEDAALSEFFVVLPLHVVLVLLILEQGLRLATLLVLSQ